MIKTGVSAVNSVSRVSHRETEDGYSKKAESAVYFQVKSINLWQLFSKIFVFDLSNYIDVTSYKNQLH